VVDGPEFQAAIFSEWEKILGTLLAVYPKYLIGRLWNH
jgi:hypothetical protein